MNTIPIRLDAARIVLRLMLREDLPGIAMEALKEGCKSESLCLLAGLSRHELDEAMPLFLRALNELGLEFPSARDSLMLLARQHAQQIVDGSLSAHDGARLILELTRRTYEFPPEELHTFVYAECEWNERPEDGPIFEAGVLLAARSLLSSSF